MITITESQQHNTKHWPESQFLLTEEIWRVDEFYVPSCQIYAYNKTRTTVMRRGALVAQEETNIWLGRTKNWTSMQKISLFYLSTMDQGLQECRTPKACRLRNYKWPKTIATRIKCTTQMTSNKTWCQTNSANQLFYLLMKITCPRFQNGQEHFYNWNTDCTLIAANQQFYLLMKITCPHFRNGQEHFNN